MSCELKNKNLFFSFLSFAKKHLKMRNNNDKPRLRLRLYMQCEEPDDLKIWEH